MESRKDIENRVKDTLNQLNGISDWKDNELIWSMNRLIKCLDEIERLEEELNEEKWKGLIKWEEMLQDKQRLINKLKQSPSN